MKQDNIHTDDIDRQPEQSLSLLVPAVRGIDLAALNALFPFGDKAGYPSDPTTITNSLPIAKLGLPKVGSQLLEARDAGNGREGEIAIIKHNVFYSYLGMFQSHTDKTTGRFNPLLSIYYGRFASDDLKTIDTDYKNAKELKVSLQFENDRATFRRQTLSHLLNAFNAGAMTNSKWSQRTFGYRVKKDDKFDKNGGPLVTGSDAFINNCWLGDQGYYNDDESTTPLGGYNATIQELSLYTMITAELSCASFLVNWYLLMTQRHALIAKFPKHEGRISDLIGRMNRSAYMSVIHILADKLYTCPFDFNEWQTNVKPLIPASSRNLGSDDSLLITNVHFIKPESFTKVLQSDKGVLAGSDILVDTDKLIIDSTLYSDVIDYIIGHNTSTPDQFLNAQIGQWTGWADRFQTTFMDELQMLEIIGRQNLPTNLQPWFAFNVERGLNLDFDNYIQAYDIIKCAALGGARWDSNTQVYQFKLPYYRKQDGVIPMCLSDEGYYNRWVNQVGMIIGDNVKPSSMILSRIISDDIVLLPYHNGEIDKTDYDGDGVPGYTLKFQRDNDDYQGYVCNITKKPSTLVTSNSIKRKQPKVTTNTNSNSDSNPNAMQYLSYGLHVLTDVLQFIPQVKLHDTSNPDAASYIDIIMTDSKVITTVMAYATNVTSFKYEYERANALIPLNQTILA